MAKLHTNYTILKLLPQVPAVRNNHISSRINLERTRPMCYVLSKNRKSLRKGFEVVMMAVETGERSEFFKAEILIHIFFILMFIVEYIKRLKCLLRFILTPFKGSELNACNLF